VKPGIQNFRSGALRRSAWVAVPAVAAILGVSGVTVRPILGLDAAQLMRQEAAARLAACNAMRATADHLAASGVEARIELATKSVAALLPGEISAVEVHGLLQVLARRHAVLLQSVEIGITRDTSFVELEDRVVMLEVGLRGAGTLEGLNALVEDARTVGLPVSVNELTLTRAQPNEPQFEFRLMLGICHRAPKLGVRTSQGQGTP